MVIESVFLAGNLFFSPNYIRIYSKSARESPHALSQAVPKPSSFGTNNQSPYTSNAKVKGSLF